MCHFAISYANSLIIEWRFILALCNETIVALSFDVLFKRGQSLVIALSSSIICWPLKKSDCPLMTPRVFCNVYGGNRIQTGFPWPCLRVVLCACSFDADGFKQLRVLPGSPCLHQTNIVKPRSRLCDTSATPSVKVVNWIRCRILYVKMNMICRQWRHWRLRRVGRLLGHRRL